MEDVEAKIIQAIRKIVKIPEDMPITGDSELSNIGVDSFAAIDLVFTLEDIFDIKISDTEMMQMKTLKDIVDGIKTKTKI